MFSKVIANGVGRLTLSVFKPRYLCKMNYFVIYEYLLIILNKNPFESKKGKKIPT